MPDPALGASHKLANGFDSHYAFDWLKRQVALGPRPSGSPQSRQLAEMLKDELPDAHFEAVPGGLRNVVGVLPGKGPAIVVAAHYDTKVLPNFVGAEDGAGGTAAVLGLAKAMKKLHRGPDAPAMRFVLFDGEENPDDATADFLTGGDRGSKAYVARHAKQTRLMILLDFVAQKDLSIPYEPGSDANLWKQLRSAAVKAGVGSTFPNRTQGQVEDDHTPFVQAGIPAIDLIDFDFPCWHQTCDDLSAVSERSLNRSGEAVLELLKELQ